MNREAFKIHENKKLFMDALLNVHAADHTILAGINRMYEKDGIQRFSFRVFPLNLKILQSY